VQNWEVDIISLSFGSDQAVDIIENVINEHANKVLFFAAASNCGGNEPGISWPARHGSVISIYASDGDGNSYKRNPNPMENHYNLSMLGTAVSGLWPHHLQPSGRYKYKSGTSCSTPIAAGVAANILTLMRRQAKKDSKITIFFNETLQAIREKEYLMKKLRQPQVMRISLCCTMAHLRGVSGSGLQAYQRCGGRFVRPKHGTAKVRNKETRALPLNSAHTSTQHSHWH
jgi:hypothetical protein